MVDSLFSFAEAGFQEFETKTYCTGILTTARLHHRARTSPGMPTAWTAHVGLRQAGDRARLGRATACSRPPRSRASRVSAPFIEGAPGHGEGHNTGIPLSITAAIALKTIMEREQIPGTIEVWPGIAEELLGGKA